MNKSRRNASGAASKSRKMGSSLPRNGPVLIGLLLIVCTIVIGCAGSETPCERQQELMQNMMDAYKIDGEPNFARMERAASAVKQGQYDCLMERCVIFEIARDHYSIDHDSATATSMALDDSETYFSDVIALTAQNGRDTASRMALHTYMESHAWAREALKNKFKDK